MKDRKHSLSSITEIPIETLHAFKNHPFLVEDNIFLQDLYESIQKKGILSPLIVRPSPDGKYEILSGHRRHLAAARIGLKTLPAIVLECDDDDAAIVVVDSNQHRESLLPSEKAFSYKMKLEALQQQRKKGKGRGVPSSDTNRTTALIGSENDESYKTVQRYIRLTFLIPPLLKKVDEKQIALSPAVELSYLPKSAQEIINDFCEIHLCTPSFSQTVHLKNLYRKGELTESLILQIISQEKANQREKLSFPAETFARYFPKGYTVEQMKRRILRLLQEQYNKR